MNLKAHFFSGSRRRLSGLTLIELMVALLIGSLLIAGAVTVYVQSRNTYRVNETVARLQEVARYALNVVESDVRLAGFWGLTQGPTALDNRAGPNDSRSSIDSPVSSNCGVNWVVDAERFIEGRDAEYDLDCDVAAPNSATDWTDVLVVRRASSDVRPVNSSRIQVQTNRLHGEIFRGTTIPAGFGGPPASETRDLLVHAYYVSEGPANERGIVPYALRRQTLIGGSPPSIRDEEIIPGIQDLQIQFGLDVDGDAAGTTDRYVDPDSVPAGARITSVRIWILAVADEPEVGFTSNTPQVYANADYTDNDAFNDNRRRVLVSKTIQVRNSVP